MEKLTVGDVLWTLCKQKQTSALCATNSDRNTSKRLFGPDFTTNKVRLLRNYQPCVYFNLYRSSHVARAKIGNLSTDDGDARDDA